MSEILGTPVPLGLGTSNLGSKYPWRHRAVIAAACRMNVPFIDTAALYGAGSVERLIGRVLKQASTPAIITKVGVPYSGMLHPQGGEAYSGSNGEDAYEIWEKWFAPSDLSHHLRQSLARLNRTGVEYFLLHSPPPSLPIGRYVDALRSIAEAGLAKSVGFSLDIAHEFEDDWADAVETSRELLVAGSAPKSPRVFVNRLRSNGGSLKDASNYLRELGPRFVGLVGTRRPSHLAAAVDEFGS